MLIIFAIYGLQYWGSLTARPWVYTYIILWAIFLWLPLRYKPMPVILGFLYGSAVYCLVAVNLFHLQPILSNLLIIPAGSVAAIPRLSRRQSIQVLLSLIAASIISLGRDLQSAPQVLFPLIGTYAGVYAGRVRREARTLDRRRLAELEVAHQQLQRAHDELQAATAEAMQSAALAERAHIARDIHDGVGHQLTSLIVSLQAIDLMLPDDPHGAKTRIPELLSVARESMSDVRSAVIAWSKDETKLGLSALRGLVHQTEARAGIPSTFHADAKQVEWPNSVSVTLYRILQEALTNAVRHAKTSTLTVCVEEADEQVTLRVVDDGIFTRHADPPVGYGISQMRERSREAGGTLIIRANEPHGMIIEATLPLHPLGLKGDRYDDPSDPYPCRR
ncbi:hypothetical protein AYW79_02870 [Ferroacidibacillus organovorans]|uniref:histidine kinase n=2 Tax=Ferroacidibacillus organovorans TaxID=1765683 RepID=A0A853KCV4_9BACL|nr:hypothetical protein AYJ22_06590 [Ferroacidibacillus organovorans]OAG94945.1 hypothetical protein AYW79_02870 [Ferroacidibacillus organovorans]